MTSHDRLRATIDAYGFTRAQIAGRLIEEFPSRDRPTAEAMVDQLLNGGRSTIEVGNAIFCLVVDVTKSRKH